MTRAGEDPSRNSGVAAAIVSALIAIALYAVTLGGTYIYDDVLVVHHDSRVLQPRLFYQLWTQPFFQSSVDHLYRPLVSSSFAIQNYLHGDRPWAFHAVNILLHAAVCAMVALLAARIAGSLAAWVSGVLFAVHPVHVEAVAGLVGRAESACALAMIGGVLIFLKSGPLTGRRAAAISACFLAALLSKEHGVLLPLLLIFAYPLRSRRTESDTHMSSPKQQQTLESQSVEKGRFDPKILIVLLCMLLAFYLLLREQVASLSFDRNKLDWSVNPLILSKGRDRLLMPIVLLGHYMRLLIFPSVLSIDYGGNTIGPVARFNDPYLYLGIGALLVWSLLLILAWRRRKFDLIFCLLSLGIYYGMVGNVVALIGTNLGDRLMYIPSIFFLMILGIGARSIRCEIAVALLVVITIAASVRTSTYAKLWNDPEALYSYTLAHHPDSERAARLLANVYLDRGEWERARLLAARTSSLMPERWEPYRIQIDALVGEGKFDDAIAVANEGIAHVTHDAKLIVIQWREQVMDKRDATTRAGS